MIFFFVIFVLICFVSFVSCDEFKKILSFNGIIIIWYDNFDKGFFEGFFLKMEYDVKGF